MFGFLNPLALFGLIAAGLPLLIHLLSRWRTRSMDFSSLMLLRRVQSRNVRRLRTRQWLLLILRTLIIALLVLVPARPTVRGLLGTGPRDHLPVEAALVADVSASTRYVDSRGRAFDLLAGKLENVAGWLNSSDRYRLLSADDYWADRSGEWIGGGNPADGGGPSRGLAPGYGATALGPAVLRAAELFSGGENYEREIYLFTDRQRGFLGPDSIALDSAAGIRVYVVGVHGDAPANTAVNSVGFPGELVRAGAPLQVTVGLAAHGAGEAATVLPRVYVDGRLVGQGEAEVEPGGRAVAVVEIPPLEPGWHELSAEIDADGLAADNSRSSVLRVPPRENLLLVERGLADGPDYLGTALDVLGGSRARAVEVRREVSLPSSVADAGIVLVHGLDYPRASWSVFLTTLRRTGTHALLVPRAGEGIPRSFNDAANRLQLPLELGGGAGLGEGAFDTPSPAGDRGAVFGRLFDAISGLSNLRIDILRSFEQPPGERTWDLATSGGRTWLRMVRHGNSNVMLAATDLGSSNETELPDTPLFVPLLHSLVTLLGHTGPLAPSNVAVGEPAEFGFGAPVDTDGMELHGPGGGRFLLPPGERTSWRFEDTDTPGAYWLYRAGELAGGFAVGLDTAESDLSIEPEGRIADKLSGAELHLVEAGTQLEDAVLAGRGGVEIWPVLLALALLLLGVEQVVANRGRDEDE